MKENKIENGCERISKEDFPENWVGRLSNNSRWRSPGIVSVRVIQQIPLGGLSNIFYRNSIVCVREQKPFVLKIVFFSHLA